MFLYVLFLFLLLVLFFLLLSSTSFSPYFTYSSSSSSSLCSSWFPTLSSFSYPSFFFCFHFCSVHLPIVMLPHAPPPVYNPPFPLHLLPHLPPFVSLFLFFFLLSGPARHPCLTFRGRCWWHRWWSSPEMSLFIIRLRKNWLYHNAKAGLKAAYLSVPKTNIIFVFTDLKLKIRIRAVENYDTHHEGLIKNETFSHALYHQKECSKFWMLPAVEVGKSKGSKCVLMWVT